jgi:hypothetical protein
MFQMIERAVADDFRKPSAKSIGSTARIDALKRLDERLLADILGIGSAAADRHGNNERGAVMTSHQMLEGRFAPVACLRNEDGVTVTLIRLYHGSGKMTACVTNVLG